MSDIRDHLRTPERRPGGAELPAWPVLVVAGVVLYLGVLRPASLRAAGVDPREGTLVAVGDRPGASTPTRSVEDAGAPDGLDGWASLAPLPGARGPAARRASRGADGGVDGGPAGRPPGAGAGSGGADHTAPRSARSHPGRERELLERDPSPEHWIEHQSTWPDGSLEARGHVLEGERVGEWELYAPGGVLLEVISYEAGVRHGSWRAYAESGALVGSGQYEGGLRNGSWVLYYSDGGVRERGEYRNGLREGSWEFYDDLGLPTIRAGEYAAGVKLD